MATTDFLPFATATGANVESQATYAGLSSTANGFSAGTAASAQVNKVLRQSSFMVAAIAEMLVGFGISTADDGNLTNLVNDLLAGFSSSGFLSNLGFTSGTNWFKLPNGVIFQYGSVSSSSSMSVPVVFPIAFLSSVYGVYFGMEQSTSAPNSYPTGFSTSSLTGFYFFSNNSGPSYSNWLAVGK